MPRFARPVRSVLKRSFRCAIAPFMCCSMSFSSCRIRLTPPLKRASRCLRPRTTRSMFPFTRRLKTLIGMPLSMQSAIAAASMTLQPCLERLPVGDVFRNFAPRSDLGVGVVDAVHPRRLQQHLGLDLVGAQRRRRVGREERVARAAGEEHDAALLEVPDRAPADERLGDLPHLDRRHQARARRPASRGRPGAPGR